MRHLHDSEGDVELLDAWRQRGDREAMDALVRRHIGFVYATARRMMRDAHLAEDVTQAVFMLLITKSPRLRSTGALVVWLHRTAGYACANARRMELRRARRERNAAQEAPNEEPAVKEADDHAELMPVLDDAMESLSPSERAGVILCFFQRCTYGQIGAMLGVSEEAARKRITRAVERMRAYLTSRGVVTTGAALSAYLAQEAAVAAPAPLLSATANIAALSQLAAAAAAAGAGGASSTAAIVKGVIHSMFIAKLKIAAAACAAIVFGGVVTGAAINQRGAPGGGTTSAAAGAHEPGALAAKVSDQIEARFLGVNRWGTGSKGWWAPDGSSIPDPRGPFRSHEPQRDETTTHQMVLHVTDGDAQVGYAVSIPQARSSELFVLTSNDEDVYLHVAFVVPAGTKAVDVELSVADGEWQTICASAHDQPGRPPESRETPVGGVAFTHVSETPQGNSIVYVAHDVKQQGQFDVRATDAQHNERACANVRSSRVGSFHAVLYEFDLPPEQILGFVAKVRPYNRQVIARNVTLDPAHPTKPHVVVEDVPEKE